MKFSLCAKSWFKFLLTVFKHSSTKIVGTRQDTSTIDLAKVKNEKDTETMKKKSSKVGEKGKALVASLNAYSIKVMGMVKTRGQSSFPSKVTKKNGDSLGNVDNAEIMVL